jgi:hypothetical protein
VNEGISIAERFLLDDGAFAFAVETPAAVEETLYGILDLLDYAGELEEEVAKWSDVWSVPSSSGRTLSEWLFERNEVDADLRRLLGSRLQKVHDWDESSDLTVDLDMDCAGSTATLVPTVALGWQLVRSGRHVACLTSDQAARRGAIEVGPSGDRELATLFFVANRQDGTRFWRYLVAAEDADRAALRHLSDRAFPTLRFASGIWGQLDRLEGAFRDVRPLLVVHLAGLSDHALSVWGAYTEPHRIATEMKSRAGIDCSPDSPKTHKNRAAMEQRVVLVGEARVKCEWHTKLEAHRNRIHFAVLGDHVVIGAFAKHLDT